MNLTARLLVGFVIIRTVWLLPPQTYDFCWLHTIYSLRRYYTTLNFCRVTMLYFGYNKLQLTWFPTQSAIDRRKEYVYSSTFTGYLISRQYHYQYLLISLPEMWATFPFNEKRRTVRRSSLQGYQNRVTQEDDYDTAVHYFHTHMKRKIEPYSN